MKQVKDHYFHKAKQEGYAARAIYKIEEIDRKHRILKQGHRVLDLGCAPGSWMQYASKKVGSHGFLLGIDLQPVALKLPQWVQTIQADCFEISLKDFPDFDVILSDMAPNTTGIRSVDAQRSYDLGLQVLTLSQTLLKQEGSVLVKIFQGKPFEELRKLFQQEFFKVQICKPQSSRKESFEVFLLGNKKRFTGRTAIGP